VAKTATLAGNMDKKQLRDHVLGQVDGKLGMIKVLQGEISDMIKALDGEWVIQKRWLKDVTSHGGVTIHAREGQIRYFGVKSPGDVHYCANFLFKDPYAACKGFSGKTGGVKMMKSPRDAVFIAECLAGSDRKFETQETYTIEIVDRLDGEVFQVITKAYRATP
jgi:hypothetical protein